MEKQQFLDTQNRLLQDLMKHFDSNGLRNEWNSKAENGLADMVVVNHPENGLSFEDLLGQYFFIPDLSDTPSYHLFNVSLFISDSVADKETQALLVKAITKINPSLPKGAFVLNEQTESLAYRYTASVSANMEYSKMFDMICSQISSCLIYVIIWMDILLSLETGTATYSNFLDVFRTLVKH